jgi:tetratricopeptide (TPR) repeat protein
LSDYKAPHETGRIDITERVRQELNEIIVSHQSSVSAEYHFLAAEYDEVIKLLEGKALNKLSSRDRNVLAWTCMIQGNQLHDIAKSEDSEELHRQAIEKFRYAAKADSSVGEAYYNWGNVLFDLSLVKRHGVPEAMTQASEKLLHGAIAKYKLALAIDPTIAEAHNNWGNALGDLARGESPEGELKLLNEALRHYEISAPRSEVPDVDYCNWGKALHEVARRTGLAETFADSFEKFRIAADCNPENYSVFLSWGHALADAARRSRSDTLLREAFRKYRRASEIRPDDTASLHSWVNELSTLADRESGIRKKRLLKEAASIRRKLGVLRARADKIRMAERV